MYCGTIPCNEPTDIGHLANIVFVYNQICKDSRFDFNKDYFMSNLKSFLDRMSKDILDNLSAEYMDLCHKELHPYDDNLSTWVYAYDREKSPEDRLWTLECLVGWCIHDAFVTYLYRVNSGDEINIDRRIAFELYVMKNDWHNAVRDDSIRTMRHTTDKYNELLKQEHGRFYLESGEIYE